MYRAICSSISWEQIVFFHFEDKQGYVYKGMWAQEMQAGAFKNPGGL